MKRKEVEALATRTRQPRGLTDEGAGQFEFNHGTVTANYSLDSGAQKTVDTWRDFYITGIYLQVNTDPTAEIANGPIPVSFVLIKFGTGIAYAAGIFSIPNNCHVHFHTPIKIPRGMSWQDRLYLGGSTDLDLDVYINGFYDDY